MDNQCSLPQQAVRTTVPVVHACCTPVPIGCTAGFVVYVQQKLRVLLFLLEVPQHLSYWHIIHNYATRTKL